MKIKDYKTKIHTKMKDYYLIYCRKSSESEDRQMESIPAQISILREIAKTKGFKVLKTFKESKSAKKPGRPLFNELVELMDTRDDIKGVLCWKLNRLFRNPEDEGKVRQRLSDGRIDEIITPNKIYHEAESDFLMAVEGAEAQRFIKNLREDTKRGLNAKIEKGIFPGLAPVGYKNDIYMRQGEKTISPRPVYFPLMRKLFEFALTGNYSLVALVKEAKKMGIKNSRDKYISKSQMSRVMSNPFYAKKFEYAGVLYHNAKHKRMLTDEEFDTLQDILAGRSRPRKQKHDFLTGLIRCGKCGNMITAETHTKHYKNGTSQVFEYYRCTSKAEDKCGNPYLSSTKLEEQVDQFLEGIVYDEDFVYWAIECLNENNKEQMETKSAKLEALQKEYTNTLAEMDNLLKLKISPLNIDGSVLSDAKFKCENDKLKVKRKKIKKQLKKLDKSVDRWVEFCSRSFNFAVRSRQKFEKGNMDDKKIILRSIGTNLILNDRKLEIYPRKPIVAMREAKLRALQQNISLEPNEFAKYKAQMEHSDIKNTVWGG